MSERFSKSVSCRCLLVLALFAGFLSMSQEITWITLLAYMTGGQPTVFADVLGFLLLGTAIGSLIAGLYLRSTQVNTLRYLFWLGLPVAALFLLVVPVASRLIVYTQVGARSLIYASVMIVAAFWGSSFPFICAAIETNERNAGWRVSCVYMANILGAVTGPLLTGLLLLDIMTLQQLVLWLSVGMTLFALLCLFMAYDRGERKGKMLGALLLVIPIALLSMLSGDETLERLHHKGNFLAGSQFKREVQSRYGIITVAPGQTDILYGGGVYDGQFNVDPFLDTNGIRRAYMLASLHDRPQTVLMIGLGSGSWASVVASHREVSQLDVVEINPDYLALVKEYPYGSRLLADPKVNLMIDDGRRWLRRNADRRYDVIVMNTSFHWRNYMTYLLSEDFFKLCQHHLKEGGVLYFNTTFSKDVLYTVAGVYDHVTVFGNFAAASMSPFVMGRRERMKNLLLFEDDQGSVFDPNKEEHLDLLTALATIELPNIKKHLALEKGLLKITDDNLATEYKLDSKMYNADWKWSNLFERLMPGQ